MKGLRVQARVRRGAKTELRLDTGDVVSVRPFAPVGEGDFVLVGKGGKDLKLVLKDGDQTLELSKPWSLTCAIQLGHELLNLTIKEVETESELAELKALKQYHYRGEKTAGRAVPLIAVTSHRLLPRVIGFIEITSALLVNSARRRILDRPFSDSASKVQWQRWDMPTAKKHTKRLARISRCVIFPELRGLGIAAKLAIAATDYARNRWQYGGSKAIFLEITADMLRYSPFVLSAGFVYVGDTEGNGDRMLRDMKYLLKRTLASGISDDFPQGGGGIMSLQRSYATMLLSVMKDRRIGLEKLLNTLRLDPDNLSDDEWIALHRVFRRPKPTYMYGLSEAAKRHLQVLSPMTRPTSNSKTWVRPLAGLEGAAVVRVSGLTLVSSVMPSTTPRSRKVAEAFGIVAKRVDTMLIQELSLQVNAGEVVFLTGPSGTGKSVLLKAIHAGLTGMQSQSVGVTATSGLVRGSSRAVWVSQCDLSKAPVDLLENVHLEEALSLLGATGLAESSLFVRPAATLSDGQRYRLAIACALANNPDVVLIDAFCEPLDDLSAAAVCKGLRALSRRSGLAVMVATASPDRLLPALVPDTVVQLLPGRSVKIHKRSGAEEERHEDKEGSYVVKA